MGHRSRHIVAWQDAAVLLSTIATADYHTGREPFRIVADPAVGQTVAERRTAVIEDSEVQALRAVLCSEPHGQLIQRLLLR
jgi:proline racemase/trans-L-3-hydroxyproline dehydratase